MSDGLARAAMSETRVRDERLIWTPEGMEHHDNGHYTAWPLLLKERQLLKRMAEALEMARVNVAYAYEPENCGDHCRNNCRDCVLRNTLNDLDAVLAEYREAVK